MKTAAEQILADAAAEAADLAEAPARSFRGDVETLLESLHERLTKCESGNVGAGVDDQGNSVAGMLRTFDTRIQQVESVQAENTSNILRVSDLVQTQMAGVNQRLADMANAIQALKPQQQ